MVPYSVEMSNMVIDRTILLTEDEPEIRDTNERRIGDMKMNGQPYFGDV
ncbi:hypothetical protein QMM44_04735 [Leptospira santarosai]|uniref:Uncharacterized protein n=1 Tax=Leptospira santarosai serovar Shermani str. LT 821 TaxID=758847 RepID=K8Y4L3_9LEPT|nr:hypothetical protein [Leptospira santarosai]EKT85617.1 hypothetical protein LSS_16771 [Leptospira santarosai serovar Shermani str. LT 821]MDI7202756.1 hypothetical protein [Leptospira santarosai]